MNEDEITNLKIMICNLDLSVGTKEKLYNQAHKIRNEIERLEKRNKEIYEGFMATQEELKEYAEENERLHSIIKEVREYIDKEYEENCIIVDYCDNPITPQDLYSDILEILDKGE